MVINYVNGCDGDGPAPQAPLDMGEEIVFVERALDGTPHSHLQDLGVVAATDLAGRHLPLGAVAALAVVDDVALEHGARGLGLFLMDFLYISIPKAFILV